MQPCIYGFGSCVKCGYCAAHARDWRWAAERAARIAQQQQEELRWKSDTIG